MDSRTPDDQPTSPARAATIYDVARLAGVSHQTVSRLVKGFTGIRPETRLRVQNAIETLNYRPNLAARSLATNRSQRIAALTHELLEVGPGRTLQGASLGARDAGYLLDIVSLDLHDPTAIASAVGLLDQRDLAGVIAFAETDGLVEAFRTTEFLIPAFIDTENDDSLTGDMDARQTDRVSLNGRGTALLVEHLVALGHTQFFHIAGPPTWRAAQNRELAYTRTVRSHGLVSVGTLAGQWSAESGHACAMAMPLDRGVTALVVANDQMALGALGALAERGVRVPLEMSVVGFDDMPDAGFYQPPLTTVLVDYERQGRIAVGRMIAKIEGSSPETERTGSNPVEGLSAAPPKLVVRSSTAPPPRL